MLYSIDGGESFSEDGNFVITEPGDYNIVVKDSAGCKIAGSTLTITQPDSLKITAIDSVDVTFNGGDNGLISITVAGGTQPYEFILNEGTPQGSGEFPGLTAGRYEVTVQDANNCGPVVTDSITIEEPPVGLSDLGVERVRFYPNPVVDQLNLEFTTSQTRKVQVSIMDASGKLILSKKYRPVNGLVKETMDISALPGGIYFLRIGEDGEVMKLVKN